MLSTICKAALAATLLAGSGGLALAQTGTTLGTKGSVTGSGSAGTTIDAGKNGASAGAGAGVGAGSSSSVGIGGSGASSSVGAGSSTSGSADIAAQPSKK